jgi:hypothetical protein
MRARHTAPPPLYGVSFYHENQKKKRENQIRHKRPHPAVAITPHYFRASTNPPKISPHLTQAHKKTAAIYEAS